MDTAFLIVRNKDGKIEYLIKFEDISFIYAMPSTLDTEGRAMVKITLKNDNGFMVFRDNMEEAYALMEEINSAIGVWTERVASSY